MPALEIFLVVCQKCVNFDCLSFLTLCFRYATSVKNPCLFSGNDSPRPPYSQENQHLFGRSHKANPAILSVTARLPQIQIDTRAEEVLERPKNSQSSLSPHPIGVSVLESDWPRLLPIPLLSTDPRNRNGPLSVLLQGMHLRRDGNDCHLEPAGF